jgi:hypothetical protein
MKEKGGYIYILTNPSFKEYVKIGYADDVEQRLKQLNRSECIPFAFRIYAVYEVDSRLSDIKIHSIIDKLNPNLRSIDTFEGKERKREFYAMTPEDAYSILEAIAEINGKKDKLKLVAPTKYEKHEEEMADDVKQENIERLTPFNFNMVNIKPGEELEFANNTSPNNGVTCIVVNDKQVEYNGEKWSLSSLATKLSNAKWAVAGPRYFKYKGEWLNSIRKRQEDTASE